MAKPLKLHSQFKLFSEDNRHPKMNKGLAYDIMGMIMHLAPAKRSGYEVCPMRSAGCTASCLNTAGYQYARKENARILRTKLFFQERPRFMEMLMEEVYKAQRRSRKRGMVLSVRLNGTSDIPWENVPCGPCANIMGMFPEVAFCDYTKRPNRKDLPGNYRLVFSRSEDNLLRCITAIRNGMNVAAVFRTPKFEPLPDIWAIGQHTLRVIDGDDHDYRYADYDDYPDERVIVGLRAKGKAKHDRTGFVIDPAKRRFA